MKKIKMLGKIYVLLLGTSLILTVGCRNLAGESNTPENPTTPTNPSNPTVTGDTPTSSENGHLTFTNLTLNEVSGASVENKTVTFTQWGTVYWKYDGIDSYDKIRFTVSSDDASADTDDIKLNLLLGGYNSSSGDLANNEDLIWIDI